MILAAGRGTRLGSLGRRVPKALVDIGGKPLLARHFSYLEKHGVTQVVINTHHRAEQVESYAARYRGPMNVVCVREAQLLGTAGAVRNALPYLNSSSFVVLYGDVLLEEPVDAMMHLHVERRALATIAVFEADSAEGKGVVEVDGSGFVTGFSEKGRVGVGRVLINSGVYVIDRALVRPFEQGAFLDFGHDVFPSAVRCLQPIYAFRLASPVIDIGTPEGLSRARAQLAEQSPPNGGL